MREGIHYYLTTLVHSIIKVLEASPLCPYQALKADIIHRLHSSQDTLNAASKVILEVDRSLSC